VDLRTVGAPPLSRVTTKVDVVASHRGQLAVEGERPAVEKQCAMKLRRLEVARPKGAV